MSRLSVVVALTGVKVDWVKGYGVMNAMKPPWLEKGFAMGMFPAFESADGKLRITEASAITEYRGFCDGVWRQNVLLTGDQSRVSRRRVG